MRNITGKEIDGNEFERCQQVKCHFFINGGCKSCDSCQTESFVLKKDCERCYQCSREEGELRFGNGRHKIAIKNKPEEIRERLIKIGGD